MKFNKRISRLLAKFMLASTTASCFGCCVSAMEEIESKYETDKKKILSEFDLKRSKVQSEYDSGNMTEYAYKLAMENLRYEQELAMLDIKTEKTSNIYNLKKQYLELSNDHDMAKETLRYAIKRCVSYDILMSAAKRHKDVYPNSIYNYINSTEFKNNIQFYREQVRTFINQDYGRKGEHVQFEKYATPDNIKAAADMLKNLSDEDFTKIVSQCSMEYFARK